ncbi:MAG: iron complex outermembrane receptor protein [Phenylobacterium sp.]|jgi:iron complex outermembrane receptor protein
MFKRFNHNNVAKAVRYALLSGVTLSMLPVQSFAAGADEAKPERISVTGSRLQKAEFDQAAPVQVLDISEAVKSGVSSVAELLQRTSMAGGQQLDATYNSNSGNSNASEAPPSGGVGSSNIGLRGLGPERTLILVNGRRLGSSGVRGAPSQPDLSLLPLNMVDRIEVITEGASSIYGADAVAGVINIIMKRGYEGAEFAGNVTTTKDGGGDIRQFSFVSGHQGEKSNLVISGSYYQRDAISVGQRADGCIRRMAVGEDGTIYDECRNRFFNNAVLNFSDLGNGPNGGDIFGFYTPGSTNAGVMNWSTGAGLAAPNYDTVLIDPTGSGRNNYTYDPAYHDQWDTFNSDLVQPVTRFTLAANGTYALDLFGGDEEFFYETYYFHRHLTAQGSSEQHLPTVAGMIPHEGEDGLLVRNEDGSAHLVDNPMNPFSGDAMLVMTIDELSQKRDVELDHVRFVAGLKGDITFDTLAEKGWNYEISASYDRGMGHQSQPVLHEEHLFFANETLRLDAAGTPKCGVDNLTSDFGGVLTLKPCVVIDWFNPSFFSNDQKNGGSFSTTDERDYLVATRTNRTVVEQVVINAFATGELFDFSSGGTATMVFGAEYKKDDIWSAVDYLGATGGNSGENPLTEGATIGGRSVNSAYVEVALPFIQDMAGIDLLEVELAARYTDESNFGNKTTTRARLTYQPVDWVILTASYGTSFRAPNLREQFLADQFQGIGGSSDPCSVPGDASADGVYDASADTRPQVVIDNCILSGADYTSLGLNGILNIPVVVGGNGNAGEDALKPETSKNYTYGLKLTPDWDADFKLNFAFTYYDFEIEDTIRSPNGATIMNRCYNDAPGLTSPFCARLSRTGTNIPSLNFINGIDASFLNVGLETSKGFDVNIDFSTNFGSVELMWANTYTQMTEREETIFEGTDADDLLEDFGNAKHRLNSTLTLTMDNWSWMMVGRFMSGTHADQTIMTTALCAPGQFSPSTELILPDGTRPNVQPLCEAGSAFYLDTSITWAGENLRVSAGVNNLFDKQAPRISMSAGSNRANIVTSSGYDLFGQTYFVNAAYSF